MSNLYHWPRSEDRFICRREGHVPAFMITKTSGFDVERGSYISQCQRCGTIVEFPLPRRGETEDSPEHQEGGGSSAKP